MNFQHRLKWSRGLALRIVVLAVLVPYGLLLLRFSLRNDQIEYFLPVRMYMSEAFRHHEFMWWNPFMSGSYPIHCDMQSSVWNPITVLLAWLFNYNAVLLSVEFLLYYVIGAVGCFYFVRNFSRSYYSCVLMAVAYGCGGFATTISEFMSWVGSFAFLPWAVHFFYRMLKGRDIYSTVKFGVAMWLLLVCGYPSFLIYLGYGVVAVMLAYSYRLYFTGRGKDVPRLLVLGLFALVVMVLLSLPAIHSFYEYLPYYSRGTRAAEEHVNSEYFAWNYPISLLIPVAGVLVFNNNLYMGLLTVLTFVTGLKRKVLSFRDRVLLAGFLFTLLFTLGRSTPVRIWAAHHLPLMGAFGFSHSVGIFLVLIFFVWAAPGLDRLFDGEGVSVRGVRRGAGIAGVLLGVYLLSGAGRGLLKTKLLHDFYCLSGCFQLLMLGLLCFLPWIYRSRTRLLLFGLLDLAAGVFAMMPLSGLTKTSPGVYDVSVAAFYREDAAAYLFSPAARVARIRGRDPHKSVNALKVTAPGDFPSNTHSQAYFDYVLDAGRYRGLLWGPFAYSKDSTRLRVGAVELRYDRISMDVEAEDSCRMVIQQTYYGRWREGGDGSRVYLEDGGLMGVSLRKGENRVRLYYYCKDLVVEGVISVVVLLVIGVVLVIGERKRKLDVKKAV